MSVRKSASTSLIVFNCTGRLGFDTIVATTHSSRVGGAVPERILIRAGLPGTSMRWWFGGGRSGVGSNGNDAIAGEVAGGGAVSSEVEGVCALPREAADWRRRAMEFGAAA